MNAIRQAIIEFTADGDPRTLSVAQANEAVACCAQIEAAIGSYKAMAAARAAEAEGWKTEGYRSAADQLAHQLGVTTGYARRALETGRHLGEQPEVAQVALAGRLSADQAAMVTAGVAANGTKTKELLDAAADLSLPELTERVAQVKADRVDLEKRRQQIHAKRSLRRWRDIEGVWHARADGNPEDGIALWRAIDPIRRHLIVRRRGQTPNEPLEALDFDALITLANIATGRENELALPDLVELGLFPQVGKTPTPTQSPPPPADLFTAASETQPQPQDTSPTPRRKTKVAGSPTRVMIRVDLDTLLRGVPIEGELCEIAGVGPVPVSVIEDLIANDNTFLVGVLTKNHQIVGIYHHGRRPNTYQRSALEFLYPTCAAKGCTHTAALQSDHREDWAKTHYTTTDLMDQLCKHHHALKTHKNWALVDGVGKRDFVPPHDPRHPKHQTKTAAEAQPP